MKKNNVFEVKKSNELMQFLIEILPHKSRNNIKSLLSHNQVYVNDVIISQFNHKLKEGDSVLISLNKDRSESNLKGFKILFEDKDIVIVEKEAGFLTIATDIEREETVYNYLKTHVKNKDENNKIFIVHRLDKSTSGVMMFAKSEEVQQTLQTNWKKLVTKRVYVALVEGKVEKEEDTIISFLKENSAMVTFSSIHQINGSKSAVTHYKVLKRARANTLLEVKIATGRKNQIRVHMQDLGHSIVGDKKYGSTTSPIRRLGLHARILEFKHPVTGELMKFETRIPRKFEKLFKK